MKKDILLTIASTILFIAGILLLFDEGDITTFHWATCIAEKICSFGIIYLAYGTFMQISEERRNKIEHMFEPNKKSTTL